MPGRIRRGALFQRSHRGFDAARAVRHAGGGKPHLDAGQGAKQSEFVALAEMADAKHFSSELAEARAERHVVIVEHDLAEAVGVVSRRHQHRRQHRRIFRRFEAQHLEPPMRDRGAGRGRKPLVAGEHIVEPLLEQHRDRLAQAVQQVGGRRVGEEAGGVGLEHLFPVPIGPRHLVGLRGGAGLFGDGVEAEPRRQHESLLRAGDGDVDLPLVMPVIDRAERGDGIHQQQRRMTDLVDRGANLADPAGDAGGGLVVHHHHRLDGVLGILRQPGLDRRGVGAVAPIARHEVDLDAPACRHVSPQRGEMAGLDHQHLVARR